MLYVIPFLLLSFLPNYCHSYQIIAISNICHQLNSSYILPYPKGEKMGWQSGPYLRVQVNLLRSEKHTSNFVNQFIRKLFFRVVYDEYLNEKWKKIAVLNPHFSLSKLQSEQFNSFLMLKKNEDAHFAHNKISMNSTTIKKIHDNGIN